MSDWGYVALGWIATYGVVGVWYYTTRMPAQEKLAEKDNEQ